ncbi:MAG TPA: hypothetical protein DCP91_09230 [Eggerthellaceae bacterium]|nr:hypothetical protein [Eggerthellaceae bacterium]
MKRHVLVPEKTYKYEIEIFHKGKWCNAGYDSNKKNAAKSAKEWEQMGFPARVVENIDNPLNIEAHWEWRD